MYLLLSGNFPFEGKTIEYDICKKPIIFIPIDRWENISYEAQHLIERMLTKAPLERITTDLALEHDWFKQCLQESIGSYLSTTVELDIEIIKILNQLPRTPENIFIQCSIRTFIDKLNQRQVSYFIRKLLSKEQKDQGFLTIQ